MKFKIMAKTAQIEEPEKPKSFWEKAKERSLQYQIYKAKIQAKTKHPQFMDKHPQEVNEAIATNPNYTRLIERVTADVTKQQQKAIDRRIKRNGK